MSDKAMLVLGEAPESDDEDFGQEVNGLGRLPIHEVKKKMKCFLQ